MKSLKTLRSQKGFSLVELMVVVAIIGILAVIGIPQYQKFMSKARQAEAKSHLNALFQGESSVFTEYNTYAGNVAAIGGGAVGQDLRYNGGFRNADTCVGQTANIPAEADGNNDIISVTTSGATWRFAGTIADSDDAAITCGALATGYTVGAWGNPSNTANGSGDNDDVFSINQLRLLVQIKVGF